eukprot:TRINITY_DN40183_c0_g1_i1.p1 TRINITY_DN40183_c0_g1~~TRINITY_DN40183_c0_g1_i1.p1  ORF type:complete len:575 (+),score=92.54 TRINITY_DN40183_c0_g1_i1:177-1901(+)
MCNGLPNPLPPPPSHIESPGNPSGGSEQQQQQQRRMESESSKSNRRVYMRQVTGVSSESELHLASRYGDFERVQSILLSVSGEEAASLLRQPNDHDETPLHLASQYGHLPILKFFLRFADENTLLLKDQGGADAFHLAAREGHLDVVKEYLKYHPGLCMTYDLSKSTPLISAATKGHTDVVSELISVNPQLVELCRSNGKNALHMAARSGHLDIVRMLLDRDLQIARRTDKKGQTALHMAVKGVNCLEVVRLLLEKDPAIVMLPDRAGNTALHVATRKKRDEIVQELLLLRDINVNALNRSHKTALDLAEELPCSEEASAIKESLINADAVQAKNLNQPRDDLKMTVSAIKHDVFNQLKQTQKTNKKVSGIAKELKKLHREGINNATNSVTVVAVLFATVAFAAIFTVPGGFVGDNNNQPSPGTPSPPAEDNGTSVVANRMAFRIFFIANAVALFTSLAVVVVQITLVPWETTAQRQVVTVINKLMWLASVCTSIAFLASAYIIVGRHGQWMAIVVSVIGGLIMVGVLGTMTFCVVRFRRSRSLRKLRRLSISRGSASSHIIDFSENEEKIYAI